MGLAAQRAVHPLAGFRVDRQHAGAKDQPAGTDRRRLVVAVVMSQIEPRPGRSNDFPDHIVLSSAKNISTFAGDAYCARAERDMPTAPPSPRRPAPPPARRTPWGRGARRDRPSAIADW